MGVYSPAGGIPYYIMLYIRYAKGAIYIQAWASALLVLTVMGNTRASKCGTSDGKTPTLFFVYTINWIRHQGSRLALLFTESE